MKINETIDFIFIYDLIEYNLDTEVGKHLSKVVRDTHKNTLYGFFEQDLINKRDLVDISNEDIQDILKLKWYSGNYSSRIWNNTKKLAEFSKNSVISALGSGRSYDNIIKDLKGEFEQNRRYELERVVRTESAFVHTQAEKKAFEDAEIEEYKISAHLDSRTSDICTSENGNVYKLDELRVGYNAPPFHPNCRSIIVPVTEFDEDYVEQETVKEKVDNLIKSGEKIDVKKLTNEEYGYLMSKNVTRSSDVVSSIRIKDKDLDLISKHFNRMVRSLVILREERLEHILEGHKDIGENLVEKVMLSINNPKVILEDYKNSDTIMFIGENSETNVNVVVKLSFTENLENSIITAFRISEKRLNRLIKKNRIIKN